MFSKMLKQLKLVVASVLVLMLGTSFAVADAKKDAIELVEESYFTIEKILASEHTGAIALKYLKAAKAVFISPEILKGAFFIGGEGGSGIIMARASNGEWSYPAFFDVGAGSFGIQFGARKSELMLTIQNGKGLTAILNDKVTLGGELSAAIGPVGEGMEGTTTTNLKADVYSFSVNKGGFIGASIEGAAIWEDEEANAAFYEEGAHSDEIILNGKYSNPAADKLRALLASIPMEPLE